MAQHDTMPDVVGRNNDRPLGDGYELCRITSVGQQSLGRAPADARKQGKEEGKKRGLLVAQAGLSSYLCRCTTLCVNLPILGWYPHHHNGEQQERYIFCSQKLQETSYCGVWTGLGEPFEKNGLCEFALSQLQGT